MANDSPYCLLTMMAPAKKATAWGSGPCVSECMKREKVRETVGLTHLEQLLVPQLPLDGVYRRLDVEIRHEEKKQCTSALKLFYKTSHWV